MVVVCGTKDEVGGECEVVDPMGMCSEIVCQGTIIGVPYFDGLVTGRGVDEACATPADAGYGVFMACESEFDALRGGVPYADCSVCV